MKKIAGILIASTLFFSCAVKRPVDLTKSENQDPLILSVLWFQKSAEMKALYYQGYNIAERSLSEKLQNRNSGKPAAVIMDIDETILDNSPSEVYMIENNVPFSDNIWKKWVYKGSAAALPGAMEFVKFAKSKNTEVFYVTNREMPDELQPTVSNLEKLGFPFTDPGHMILKNDISTKEPRRIAIEKKYDVIMLIGDNLADFNVVFDTRGEDLGFGAVDQNREKFGTEFIILPNPMYGPWINAAIKDQQGVTTREKILNTLEGF
ncbi:MAG: 5'-nucleotidase, lipoprotein e(P4) family [Bacteroidia bacterium]|nr:5'-nucleotidase, lipoprotein e(P4) family [Bacteroidia bacterium]